MTVRKTASNIPASVPWVKQCFAPKEAAAILSLSESTVAELIRDGRLSSFKAGRARRITGQALDDYAAGVAPAA
jgi:excisionase family DNA binding protein